ncbi:hypothetical protein KPP03845_200044 (plasmid) [Streptomyces xanthophaeus]|uniref:NB-ARC domain-containing protein n=1 Tax=Streptomyces xanthophaeus TaxID=67385 RepID=UPI00233E9412|nr:NB-ARC domain-containing protein [Streptomyces xanthophaeus]WCD91083.1 hypothetical protein KPP03845_200044 [Streptomyces xanthophaeus]
MTATPGRDRVAGNTFNGPAFIQIGDGNQQNNYFVAPSQQLRQPPPVQEVADWVVDRPEADEVIATVCSQEGGAVGITTALEGAGGFGKTMLAKMVCTSPRVRQHFAERVYAFTMGRDVRRKADIARKVGEAIRFITEDATPFEDPELAGAHLGRLLDQHDDQRFLLVIDDVWSEEQLAPFLIGGRRCVRLVTTRRPESLPPDAQRIRVDEMATGQASAVLTWELPPLPEATVQGLLRATGRWPLLLRLTNRVIATQLDTGAPPAAAAQGVLELLERHGPAAVDGLAPSAGPDDLDHSRRLLDDPEQRKRLVRATVEAATELLPGEHEQRLAELGIFAEDESVPIPLAAKLWHATGGLNEIQARQLCKTLHDLSLLTMNRVDGGRLTLHDVIRDFLRHDLGPHRVAELNSTLVDAVAATLSPPTTLTPSGPRSRAAWWELTDQYLLDHAVAHMLAARRTDEAEAIAFDLRWVEARLYQRGPTAPWSDLARIPTLGARTRAQDLARAMHLLADVQPTHAVSAILRSRLEPLTAWHDQVRALERHPGPLALINAWPPPDLPDPLLLRTLTGHLEAAAIATAPDGTWLATGDGYDGRVHIWDTATGRNVTTFAGRTNRVSPRAPEGTWMADRVSTVAISPDGTWLAAAHGDGTVRIWDMATTQNTTILSSPLRPANAMAISPDGTWLAAGYGDGTVRIWDTATWRNTTILTCHDSSVLAVAIAPDGTWLATANRDGVVRIWDTTTGENTTTLGHSPVWVSWVVISPDGTWLATTGGGSTVHIWEVATGQVTATLADERGRVIAVAISPDGTSLVTATSNNKRDGTVRIWDRTTGENTTTLGGPGWVHSLAMSPDGNWLAIGHGTAVSIWDTTTGRSAAPLNDRRGWVNSVAFSPDGTWLATGHIDDDNVVRIWDRVTGERIKILTGHTGRVQALAIAPDGSWLVTVGGDRAVRIWDTGSGRTVATLTGDLSMDSVAIAPDGTWFAVGSSRGVRIYDRATGRNTTTLASRNTVLRALEIASDGTWLATGGNGDDAVRMWDTATGQNTISLTGHDPRYVQALAIAPDGTWVATVGGGRRQGADLGPKYRKGRHHSGRPHETSAGGGDRP